MDTLTIDSTISAVTVFRRGARVTRRAALGAVADKRARRLRLTGLPLTIDDTSVRARLETDDAEAVATNIRVILDAPEADLALAPPTDEVLEQARLEEAHCRATLARLERAAGRLEGLSLPARPEGAEGEAPGSSPVKARLGFIALADEERRRLALAIVDAGDAVRAATERRLELEDRFRRSSSARQVDSHELRKTIEVEVRGAASALAIDYLVAGARWCPSYRIRLQGERADVTMRAMVAQRTGEDWDGVSLALSTASADRWVERRELDSLRIGRRQAWEGNTGWRPAPADTAELFADYQRFVDGLPQPATEATAWPPERVPTGPDSVPLEMAAMPTDGALRARLEAPARGWQAQALSSAMDLPVPSAAPAAGALRAKRKRRASSDDADGPERTMAKRQEAGTEASAAEDVGALRAAEAMLGYGQLRLPTADEARRGLLTTVSAETVYEEVLAARRITLRTSITHELAEAAHSAARIYQAPLPAGCSDSWPGTYDYGYAAVAPAAVPADGAWHSVLVAQADSDADYRYVCVPRETGDVFRMADVGNPLPGPMLKGAADIYIEGDFVLTSPVDFTPPAGELVLGLGVDEGIKVVRNTRFDEVSAGLMGSSRVLKHAVTIELQSHHDRPVAVEVRERLPVIGQDEDDIELTLGDVSPAWEPWEPFTATPERPSLEGGHRWRVSLGARGKAALSVAYDIKISAKHELVGGNRREG